MYLTAKELEALMPDATQLNSDEPEMETSLPYAQLALLVSCLEWWWRDRTDFFIGANLTIYFSRQQLKNRDFRGTDFFLVKNTPKHPRRSWVVWEEDGRYPDVIIELLSDETKSIDKGLKKDLYQNRFRAAESFWFSPSDLELAGFQLIGEQYQAIVPNAENLLWSQSLELFLGVHHNQLRYFQQDGQLVPTPEESALLAQQKAEQLAEQLRSLGIAPDC